MEDDKACLNATTKRTRKATTILVEFIPQGSNGWKSVAAGDTKFADVQQAEKWIRDNGQDGQTYRVVREVLTRKVKVQNVRKTVLE